MTEKLPPAVYDMVEEILNQVRSTITPLILRAYQTGHRDAVATVMEVGRDPPKPPLSPAAAPPREPPAPIIKRPVHAASLREKPLQVFLAIERLTKDGAIPSQNEIARACGYAEGAYVVQTLTSLETKGYIRNDGQRGRPDWKCLVTIQASAPPVSPPQPVAAPAPQAPVPAPAPAPARAAAPQAKKIYPSVAELRKPAPAPARPAYAPTSNLITQQAFGADGNGGRGAFSEGGIKVSTYLIRKGHMVTPASAGAWRVDGKVMDKHDVLDLINEHRGKADLPPAVLQDLE